MLIVLLLDALNFGRTSIIGLLTSVITVYNCYFLRENAGEELPYESRRDIDVVRFVPSCII